MTDQVPDAKLATIRSLLAKAEDPAATTAEAEAYTAKAAQLMARYGVERAMLAADDPARDVVGDQILVVEAPYAMGKAVLLSEIAAPLNVRAIRKTRAERAAGAQVIHLFGMSSDLDRVGILFTSLLVQCAHGLLRDAATDVHARLSPKVWKRDYLHGFAIRVGQRLHDAENRARAEYDAAGAAGPSTALVLVSRAALVDRAYTEAYPRRRASSGRRIQTGGFHAGDAAGSRADLGATGVSAGPRRQLDK